MKDCRISVKTIKKNLLIQLENYAEYRVLLNLS